MDTETSKEIAKLFAKNFIARSDVKAIQHPDGAYRPDVNRDAQGGAVFHARSGFNMADLLNHINGVSTYGHYMLNSNDKCKMFVFDIDLDKPDKAKPETWERLRAPLEVDSDGVWRNFAPCDPRAVWLDRTKTIQRAYFKTQLRILAEQLASKVSRELEIPVAATYTGNKGVHVYGFTGLLPAKDVREGAHLALQAYGGFEPFEGQNFFKHRESPITNGSYDTGMPYDEDLSYQCMTLEVFPKQDSLEKKGFGNLVRLPLGKNLKNPQDPTFFLDFRGNYTDQALMPREPVDALTTTNYWK